MSFESGDDPRDAGGKGPDAFRTISEVAEELGLPQHVLRFWETRFPQVRPIKRGGGRRYYRPGDVELLRGVKELLYGQGYTIRGVQRILREQGGRKIAQSAGAGASVRPDLGPEFYAPRHAAQVVDVYDDEDADRAESAQRSEPAPRVETPRPKPEPTMADAPLFAETAEISPKTSPSQPGLSETQTRRLASALEELHECRRLLGGLN